MAIITDSAVRTIKKGHPLEEYFTNPESRQVIDELATCSPEIAFLKARFVDKSPSILTRGQVGKDPAWAYRYAIEVEKCIPHPDTRSYVCASPQWAFLYALEVDQAPHPATRQAACQSAECSLSYALQLDRAWHPLTWAGVQDSPWREEYLQKIKLPRGLWFDQIRPLQEAADYLCSLARAVVDTRIEGQDCIPLVGETYIYSDNVEFLGLAHQCKWKRSFKQITTLLGKARDQGKEIKALRVGGNISTVNVAEDRSLDCTPYANTWSMTVWTNEAYDSNQLAASLSL